MKGRILASSIDLLQDDYSSDKEDMHDVGTTAFGFEPDSSDIPLLTVVEEKSRSAKEVCSRILRRPHDMIFLQSEIPSRCVDRDWVLLFSTVEHGISLNTFIRKVTGQRDTVLLISDNGGHTFGAFVPLPWRNHQNYFGTGESFVFSLHPVAAAFHWSGVNNMCTLLDGSGLLVGGGGKPAIWLDADLNQGSSGECETFGNPGLASADMFRCVHLEVWGMLPFDVEPPPRHSATSTCSGGGGGRRRAETLEMEEPAGCAGDGPRRRPCCQACCAPRCAVS